MHGATRPSPGEEGALFAADGFHPSAEGYERWAAARPAVERALAARVQARRPAAAP